MEECVLKRAESKKMTHKNTLEVMGIMDYVGKNWTEVL